MQTCLYPATVCGFDTPGVEYLAVTNCPGCTYIIVSLNYLPGGVGIMRNYRGYNRQGEVDRHYRYSQKENKSINYGNNGINGNNGRSKVVIDESTIYEIDMDCYECLHKKDN